VPAGLGALFLIAVGIGVLAVARQGWRSGELPAGSSAFSTYRPRRDSEPAAFHLFLALYLAMGTAAIVYGLLMAFGAVAPLPLR
jgi:hypothetical protein